ncbi:MAG: substrate-binding domain-containing protein [Opitutales bacterium]
MSTTTPPNPPKLTDVARSASVDIATATEALLPFLQSDDRPTAVVAYHDPIALGALCAARRLGLRVPADLSVTGFDDSFGEVADPPLTSVSHAPLEIARAAVELFLELRDSQGSPAPQTSRLVVVTPRLIVRASTGPAL